jgi:hypothetical protein
MRLLAPVMSAHWPSKGREDLLDEFTFTLPVLASVY